MRITCEGCGREVRDTREIDPNVPWVHAETGNAFCDVVLPADVMNHLELLDRAEASPNYDWAAREIGAEHGRDAASWYFHDDSTVYYRAVLAGIDDGDPAVLDTFPYADLSGEWADGYTTRRLLADVGISEDEAEEENADRLISIEDELADAYSDAFSMAASAEIKRVARLQLEGTGAR